MVSNPFRVGVIGCGFFAENHLAAWASMDDVVLAAVCDLDVDKARSAADRHKAGAAYADAAEMLDREDARFRRYRHHDGIACEARGHGRGAQTSDDCAEAARAELGGLRRRGRDLPRRRRALHGA